MKWIRNISITIIAIIICYLLLNSLGWMPNFGKWLKRKPLLIEDTPLIVKSIKGLKQLITLQSTDEVVITKNTLQGGTTLGNIFQNGIINPNDKKIGMIVKGTINMGVDFSKLTEEDIRVKGDSIALVVPAATFIETIVNPSDTDIFIEVGKWDVLEINQLKSNAKDKLMERAESRQLLDKAKGRSILVIEKFLKSIGFKKVTITTLKTN
jgi:hypothetical protein